MSAEPSPEGARGPRRVYASGAIEVHWEPRFCIHTGNCVRHLGSVFDPSARPWIDVDAADPDAIARTILTCPTGALHFRRLDGGPEEPVGAETTVEPRPNGPLFVRGRLKILGPDGHVIREDTRLALCRCGASQNKPFCDGSHRRVGFTTAPPAAEGADEAGEKPSRPATETGRTPDPAAVRAGRSPGRRGLGANS
jgi:CDGSH-type Zn-finger protein/uncharacterized Fe-S cluster protein YjdI